MTYFTPEELCMIEMLTYFNEARNVIYGAVSLSATDDNTFSARTEGKTIGEILSEFDDDKIAQRNYSVPKASCPWNRESKA